MMGVRRLPSMSVPTSAPASAVSIRRFRSSAWTLNFLHRLAVGLDLDHGHLADGIELGLAAAGDAVEHGADFTGEAFEFVVVLAEDLAQQVGARSGHDFVEAHLDRLGDEDVLSGHLIEQAFPHEVAEGFLGDGLAIDLPPCLARDGA